MLGKKDFLFELSWEVCNKIGGIHTVIYSKLNRAKKNFKNYYLIGPYLGESDEFLREDIPEKFLDKVRELNDEGIKLHFGKTNTEEKANVILVEHGNFASHMDGIKGYLWEKYKIDSMNSDWNDYDNAILWSWVCGVVIHKLTENYSEEILVHSHEWMAGGAIFYLKSLDDNRYKTVFTTHATMLGRAISGNGGNLYDVIDEIDPEKFSYDIGVHTKFQTEKSLAHFSDCFTTVSNITNDEAKHFFGKEADFLLYNGFDLAEKDKKLLNSNFGVRNYIANFLKAYFYNYYEFDTNNMKLLYTSGRNEFRNKGVDMLIESLGKLNHILKEEKADEKVVCFFLIPIGEYERDYGVLSSLKNYHDKVEVLRKDKSPPLSTHKVPWDNEIINAFFKNELLNRKEDKVKVILIPEYISEKEVFFKMDYNELASGFDLGVFPSQYEPWGYTPLESIALKVPTITTDLAGFGRYISRNFHGKENGVYQIMREKISDEETIQELTVNLFNYVRLTPKRTLIEKSKALKFSNNFSWDKFYSNYVKAYDFASKN